MRSAVGLAEGPDFAITAVTCRDDHTGWSEAEVRDDYRVVLVRRGRFRRRADGACADVDPTLAYVGVPGQEEHFAHPAGGDTCTAVSLAPALWRVVAGDGARLRGPGVYVDARLDLAHRRLLAAARDGDVEYRVTEELLGLLAIALRQVFAGSGAAGSAPAGSAPAGARRRGDDRSLVAAAREAIAAGDPASEGLFPLAAMLGVSPYRLSRAFTRVLGVSLTRYRNRVRVGRALDRIAEGESRLGDLAADLGFADQAHLCRTVRQHLGRTPTALRRLLAPS
ncbi:MAG: helix-turn-helix domain-containing protein [Micromonosporaceae bacterium]